MVGWYLDVDALIEEAPPGSHNVYISVICIHIYVYIHVYIYICIYVYTDMYIRIYNTDQGLGFRET